MAQEELFRNLLKSKRLNMGAGNRTKTKQFSTKQVALYPYQYERAYFKELNKIQKSFLNPLTKTIEENLQGWLDEYKADSSVKLDKAPIDIDKLITDQLDIDVTTIKLDAFSEDYEDLLIEETKNINEFFVIEGATLLASLKTLGNNTAGFNKKQLNKFFKQLLGVDWNVPEPWLDEVISTWSAANFDLIKSLTTEGIAKANLIVSQGVQFGLTYTEIMAQIKKNNKHITQARSRLIARDQIGKLNGLLSKRRMEEAGISMYKWATVKDERVRGNPSGTFPNAIPSHYVMDGLLCKWGDNTVYSIDNGVTWIPRPAKAPRAIPGQEIQCRCTALAYFDEIIGEIDNEINEELAA